MLYGRPVGRGRETATDVAGSGTASWSTISDVTIGVWSTSSDVTIGGLPVLTPVSMFLTSTAGKAFLRTDILPQTIFVWGTDVSVLTW